MINALWAFIRIAAFVALIVWIMGQSGQVDIAWSDYQITVDVGLFLLALLGFVLLTTLIYQALNAVVSWPRRLRARVALKTREKGYRALTLGLSAVAAGDTHTAVMQAKRAEKMLDSRVGLVTLLQAQAARLEGREEDALQSFVHLLENKDTAFLGVRGLLQSALDEGDYEHALDLALRAQKLHPRQPWIWQVVYDLHVRAHDWDAALADLKKARRIGALSHEAVLSEQCAIAIARGDEALSMGHPEDAERFYKLALKISPDFFPPIGRLAEMYWQAGTVGKAKKLLMRSWKRVSHPDYMALWKRFEPQGAVPFEGYAMVQAEQGDKAWVCEKTGRIHERYEPVSEPYCGFNTVHWAVPELNVAPRMHAPESGGVLLGDVR